MFNWPNKRKRCVSDFERYTAMISYMITDIKNVESLKKIYDFAEVIWKKEKRDNGKEE